MSKADDIVEIQALKARYCVAVDALTDDAAEARRVFGDIFLPEVIGDYGVGAPLDGIDAMTAFLCEAIASNSEWRLHMIHTPLVEVTGDAARGDWTLSVHVKRPDGPVDLLIGRYSDQFRRTPQGWRIARVRFLRQDLS